MIKSTPQHEGETMDLFIKKVNVVDQRKIKAAAASIGITLREFVIGAALERAGRIKVDA